MTEDFKEIQHLAKRVGAEIFFGDESTVRSDYHSGTTWALRERTPVVAMTGARHKVNIISAITSRGEMKFMATEGNVNAAVFIDFLKLLIADSKKPVFLILDNSPVHRSGEVQKYVESSSGRLRILFLPPYAPELNPDEHVWNYMKNHKIGLQTTKSQHELFTRITKVMKTLQRSVEKLKSFFRQPWTKYTLVYANQCTA